MDLAGLTLLLGNIPRGYQATRMDALALQQREREIAGEAAAGSSLQDFSGGYGPISAAQTGMPFGPPGMSGPQQPQQPPQQAPTPAINAPGGAGGMPPAAPPAGAGAQPQGPGTVTPGPASPFSGTSPPAGGGGMMGGMSIPQLAAVIKQRNPGIDPGTLFQAVKQAEALLNPEAKMSLALMLQNQKLSTQLQELQSRLGTQERGQDIRAETAKETTGARVGAQERGQDIRAATAKETTAERVGAQERGQDITSADRAAAREASKERTNLIQDRIDGRAAASRADKAVVKANAAQYKDLISQRQKVTDEIAEELNTTNDPKNLKTLYDEKRALDDKLVAFWKKAQDGGVTLPRPSELVGLGGGAPGANAPAASGAPQAGAPAGGQLPDGLPDPKGLAEGSRAKDPTGKVVAVIKNGAWAPPEGQ